MKQRLTDKRVIDAIQQSKGMLSVAARKLGCARSTIYEYAKKSPAVQDAIDGEREMMVDLTELALYSRIQKGDGWAICFMLKTQGKDRGYVERTEHRHGGDPDAPPIQTEGKTVHIYIPSNGREVRDGADGDGSAADGRGNRPATGAADDLPNY